MTGSGKSGTNRDPGPVSIRLGLSHGPWNCPSQIYNCPRALDNGHWTCSMCQSDWDFPKGIAWMVKPGWNILWALDMSQSDENYLKGPGHVLSGLRLFRGPQTSMDPLLVIIRHSSRMSPLACACQTLTVPKAPKACSWDLSGLFQTSNGTFPKHFLTWAGPFIPLSQICMANGPVTSPGNWNSHSKTVNYW